jgi:hypothetical protein
MNPFDRSTKFLLALLVIGVWALLLHFLCRTTPAAAEPRRGGSQQFDEITVQRINIVDKDGKNRIVLANEDRFPAPIVKGKELPRAIKPAGIAFFKPDGDECGGIGLATTKTNQQVMIVFDYAHSEAIGLIKRESRDGKNYEAALAIFDRAPLDTKVEKASQEQTQRVVLSTANKNCRLVFADPAGKERIILAVNAAGEAKLQILDKDGKEVFVAPK